MIRINLIKGHFIFENKSDFQSINSKGFGENKGELLELNIFETLYLFERNKIIVYTKKDKKMTFLDLLKEIKSKTANLDYIVYKDLKSKGYNVKTGVKFGFRFRVYDKGIKIGDDHSLWLVEPVTEFDNFKISDITGKIRVANTTKKKMMLAVVDTENDVSYFELSWKRT